MYDFERIYSSLKTSVGINQSPNYDVPRVLGFASEGATAVNEYHTLATADNVYHTISLDSNYPQYDALATYSAGDIVSDSQEFYRSLVDMNTGNPLSSPNFWEPYNYLSGYIEDKKRQSIRHVVEAFLNDKGANRQSQAFSVGQPLYQGTASPYNAEKKNQRFVGLRFQLCDRADLVFAIKTISLQLNQSQTLNLYLYNAASPTPTIIPVFVSTPNAPNVIDFNQSLKYADGIQGGTYYLGYYEEDLIGQALSNNVDYIGGCPTCSTGRLNKTRQRYGIQVANVQVRSGNLNSDRSLFAIDSVEQINKTFGLNLIYNLTCDITNRIIDAGTVLTDAIGNVFAYQLIAGMSQTLVNSGAANNIMKMSRAAMDYEVPGENVKKKMKASLTNMLQNMQGFNSPCFPHKPKMVSSWIS